MLEDLKNKVAGAQEAEAERVAAFEAERSEAARIVEVLAAARPALALICSRMPGLEGSRPGISLLERKGSQLVLFEDGTMAVYVDKSETLIPVTPMDVATMRWSVAELAKALGEEFEVQADSRCASADKARKEARRMRAVADLLDGPAYSRG